MSERVKVTVTLPDQFNNPMISKTFYGFGHLEAVRMFVKANLPRLEDASSVTTFEDGSILVTTKNESGRVWLHKVKMKLDVNVTPLLIDDEPERVNPLVGFLLKAKRH